MVHCLRLYKLFRHGNKRVLASLRTKNCFPNGLRKFDERTRQLMSTRGCVVTTLRPIALNNPGFLACQLKTRVYSHKVLLCSRENTEETSSRAKIGREKTATFQRKQPVRWYCRMWDWQHGARDRGVWRRIKELELSLERETAGRKAAEAALESKRFSVKNMNSSRMAAALPPSKPSFRRFLAMNSPLPGSMKSLFRPPLV